MYFLFYLESAQDFEYNDLYIHFFLELPKCEYFEVYFYLVTRCMLFRILFHGFQIGTQLEHRNYQE